MSVPRPPPRSPEAGAGEAVRAGPWRKVLNWLRGLAPRTSPLCDTCRYDYGSVCKRPERPNALRCPDYKRR